MKTASMLLVASSLLALAACGQGEDLAGADSAEADGMYDTVQPDLSAAADEDTVAIGAVEAPAPLPDALTGDIIAIAGKSGEFKTFITMIETAGLSETLAGPGPFTLFAPTDAAFDALPEGALSDLMRPANREKLISLVEYHVLPARVTTADIVRDIPSPATVHGDALALEAEADGGVTAGEAKIVTADIMATNGVMHIVDKVLMPAEDPPVGP